MSGVARTGSGAAVGTTLVVEEHYSADHTNLRTPIYLLWAFFSLFCKLRVVMVMVVMIMEMVEMKVGMMVLRFK